MIDRTKLLNDLQVVLRSLEADLLERSESYEVPDVSEMLHSEYEKAKTAERTAQSYEEWRAGTITHIVAAWVLSCVFARFLEDNKLVDPPMIAGPGDRLERARDEHELYFRNHPTETDREYLLDVFDRLAKLPGVKDIFGKHNPIDELPNWLSGDAAGELLKFFQRVDPETGKLVHDLTDEQWDTRFLGDLYQDLSEAARKKYALLQTPEFVEEFILDRTLDPAIAEFGLKGFRMIDPACGSGHFLLGSFRRLLDSWQRKEPGTNVRELVQRSLDSVHGVDVNPYAVAIARFRLLLAAMKASGIVRLMDAPAFRMNLACGDSLLHGEDTQLLLGDWAPMAHYFRSEDAEELNRILVPGRYHAVVANPPYITPKDRALNAAYRKRYKTCYMKYSLAVPFLERIFQLAVDRGYIGQITANSFMKREFGKKLIEEFFPKVDLTHVIDTSGAYIPGHGTPTVILFGRNRKPVASTIRTVMGIRGEPSTPENPAKGLVWTAILHQIDQLGSPSKYVSVNDSSRGSFHKHPWSIGGGGAVDLKDLLDDYSSQILKDSIDEIGMFGVTGADEVMVSSKQTFQRKEIEPHVSRRLVVGDEVRDWLIAEGDSVLLPYKNEQLISIQEIPKTYRWLWSYRITLGNRTAASCQTYFVEGLPWWEWRHVVLHRIRRPISIAFPEVATHNHFVLDRGGKIFKQSAPAIQLSSDATEEEHLALLGLLNSSTACFWLKQVCYPKGTATGDISTEKGRAEANRYAFNSSTISRMPIPDWSKEIKNRVVNLTKQIDIIAQKIQLLDPTTRVNELVKSASLNHLKFFLHSDKEEINRMKGEMVFLQEELDWTIYAAFGLVETQENHYWTEPFPSIQPSDRPFAWNVESAELPEQLVDIYEQRRREICRNELIRLIEAPVYKRLWYGRQGVYGQGSRTTEELQQDAFGIWLLNRLETYFDFDGRMNNEGKPTAKIDISLISIAKLADIASQDADFMQVGELYRNDRAFNVQKLVNELVESESVPLLPVLRYKPSGLRKRHEWEYTWQLQRQEDAIDARIKLPKDDPNYIPEFFTTEVKRQEIGDIPVPPKYSSSDFQKNHYWRLRGKLDVPKERWVSFPYCEGDDGTLTIAWAGYNHLQLASAISAYYVDVQERLGGRDDPRLLPLLACLIELLPWLKQWHNDIDPEYNLAMGDYFEGFIQEESRQMGKTPEEVRQWKPPQRTSRRRS